MASRLQHELKQNRPFAAPTQEASVALMRTADLVKRAFAAVVEPLGITVQQYNVLRILRGEQERGLPTLEIAERMIEQQPGITRLIDRLEAKGLVRRERCPGDRRQVLCFATETGLDLLARVDGAVDSADDEALGMLSDAEKTELIRLLDLIRASHAQPG